MFNRKLIKYLETWKNNPERKPLIIRGARQVGKTSAVSIFARNNFKHFIPINLEKREHLRLFNRELSLDEFLALVQVEWGKKIVPQETLIFIDEIQSSPHMIKLLRFIYEERPDLFVIAAGSLLEAKIIKDGFSFPVGRIEFCYLYPLDFFEYLKASGKDALLDILQGADNKHPVSPAVHDLALKKFFEYAMVGGMPGILKEYFVDRDINKLKALYSSLLIAYIEDVHKYASDAEVKYLSYVIETAPLFAGNVFTYERFGGSSFKSREISKAFSVLEKIMLLSQIRATASHNLPLIPKEKRPKKLIYLDVGLVNFRMNTLNDYLLMKDFDGFYQGRIAEQVVAQNLLASSMGYPLELLYWARERDQGTAEIDFCLNVNGKIIGIEVKAGQKGKLKSLMVFAEHTPGAKLVRIYSGPLKKEKIIIKNKEYSLLSIPLYLAPKMFDLLPG